MPGTLLLNACGTVLTEVSWKHAVKLVAKGKAEVHEADPEKFIHAERTQIPFPRVIRLIKWVYVKFNGRRSEGAGMCTKAGILKRDGHTCVYCGGKANTVDHVMPQSRGGKSSWENLAAACAPCNGLKADRTPEEAGMRLKWHPWRPDAFGAEQRRVWTTL